MYPDDLDPTEPPPKPTGDASNLKKAQEALRIRGYTLTALGLYKVSFFRTAAGRDRFGLVPEEEWCHLTPRKFALFLKQTPPLEGPLPKPPVEVVVEPPRKLPRKRRRAP